MKYTLLDSKVAGRICDTFYGHSEFINDKYNAFSKGNTYNWSDRDRFVKKFFSKYVGKHIVLADKEIIGYAEEDFIFTSECTSVYSSRIKSNTWNRGKPLTNSPSRILPKGRRSSASSVLRLTGIVNGLSTSTSKATNG